MPEIRANLNVDLHRRLKSEAAREGKHLKQLVAEILEQHAKSYHGGVQNRSKKKLI